MESKQENIQLERKDFFDQKVLLKGKRRSKRSQIKESFCCECGKIYLSFSALYLHAKNKHNFKLTTKLNDSVCRIESTEGFIKYTFYIIEIENKNQDNKNQIQKADYLNKQKTTQKDQKKNQNGEILQKYFRGYTKTLKSSQQQRIVEKFIKFACNEQKVQQNNQEQKINEFPNHLNNFMQYHLLQAQRVTYNSQKWKSICKVLQRLCKWMLDNKLTNLIVINDVN